MLPSIVLGIGTAALGIATMATLALFLIRLRASREQLARNERRQSSRFQRVAAHDDDGEVQLAVPFRGKLSRQQRAAKAAWREALAAEAAGRAVPDGCNGVAPGEPLSGDVVARV